MAVDPGTTAPTDKPARGRFAREAAPPAAAPAAADRRATVATVAALNLIAGIWLIIAPFVLGYGNGDPYWNDIVFGAIVACFALIRLSGAYRADWLSRLNALIGIWIFVSAFWLDATMTAGWNDIILGAIIFVLGMIGATVRDERAPRAV